MAKPRARISWAKRLRKVAFRLTRASLLAYVVAIVVFAAFQTQLIFPGTSTQGSADSIVSTPPNSEFVHLRTATDIPIVALFGPARPPALAPAPTLIYFYGNAMCLHDTVEQFNDFRRMGANVLAVEFPGYGMSGGTASETNCYAAAEAAYQYLLSRPDIDSHRLVPAGWSLGGAVAIHLAAQHIDDGHIAGLMTFSTFTSMTDLGRLHYPMFPVSLLLKHHFASEGKLRLVRVPVLIGHGMHDEIAPFAMSDRLAKAAAGPVTRLSCPAVGHNDFFDAQTPPIDKVIRDFLTQLPTPR